MYIIKKDGLYLIGYQSMGIQEILAEGKLSDILTAIWSNNKKDAHLFESVTLALTLADMFGGEVKTVNV